MMKHTLSCLKHMRRINSIGGSNNLHQMAKGDLDAQDDLNEIYRSVEAQKFEDIVVIQTKFNANPRYLILASCFNSRHLINGTEKVNKDFKILVRKPEQRFANVSISSEWNVLDFESVVVHLFSRKCREHFDIEQLWAVGERYDDLTAGNVQSREEETI